jgi:NADH-quinone oxidoreductase subunit B
MFGTACCAIELMQTGGPRTDLERFGMAPRASPRHADLMIVAGTVTYKMATRIKTLYDQMAEPKYVISMGSCASCGGLFQLSYSVLKGIDQVIPVDIYVPGCPPRPEALLDGIMKIQRRMETERGWLRRWWTKGRDAVTAKLAARQLNMGTLAGFPNPPASSSGGQSPPALTRQDAGQGRPG